MSFDSLGLSPALLRALADQGYTQPTPIQLAAIPLALAGRDLLAGAQTGTGKTAAFALPILERMFPNGQRTSKAGKPRVLILTPTRELAAQVHESLRDYGRHLGLRSTMIFGGVGMPAQVQALRNGLDIVVATPGRLLDHIDRRTIDLSSIDTLVLDEGDRMLDMGFLPAIRRVLGKLPRDRQTLLFSATFAQEIKKLANEFMRNPEEIQVAKPNSVVATVTHLVHPVDTEAKRELLLKLLSEDGSQTLVFGRTKHGADKLCKMLDKSGIRAAAIHGNKSQNQRTRALKDFKTGKVSVLVATDIAARGLDIDQLPRVINYELPMVAEDYVHRIGRTGRAGSEGVAISLVSQVEEGQLRDIHKLLGQDILIQNVAGFEPRHPLRLDGPRTSSRGPKRGAPPRNGAPRSGPKPSHRPHGGAVKRSANAGDAARPRRQHNPRSGRSATQR